MEHIIACWSTQVGKTLMGMIGVKYSAAVLKRPALHVMPKAPNAESINVERYQPTIRGSPRLNELVDPRRKKEFTRNQIRLNGIWIDFVGARSPADLASRAKGTLLLDECDKYPDWSGEEADPIALATERTRTYFDRKIMKVSTPTTESKYIWPELLRSTNERYHVPCPHCGEYQELVWGEKGEGTPGIKWPEDERDPDTIIDEDLAWYECASCHQPIKDSHKYSMNLRGVWVPKGLSAEKDGSVPGIEKVKKRRSGFHLWAAYSPWLTFSRIAAEFLECFSHGRVVEKKMANFTNSVRALPTIQSEMELKTEAIDNVKLPYHCGTLPAGVKVVFHTVDIQEEAGRRYMYYVTRGWGAQGRSWLLDCGRCDSWERVADLFRATYTTAEGQALQGSAAAIDCGFKTDEVYTMCGRMGAIAIKGHGTIQFHQRMTVLENKIHRLVIDTDHYKDKLHRLIGDAETWWVAIDTPGEYASHLTAEKKAKEICKTTGKIKFVWKVDPPGAANHYLDCEVYQLALAEHAGVDKEPQQRRIVTRKTGEQ